MSHCGQFGLSFRKKSFGVTSFSDELKVSLSDEKKISGQSVIRIKNS